MSQFLEGDIRLARQHAELNQRGLGLQQRQLGLQQRHLDLQWDSYKLNKEIRWQNNLINWINAGISLTNAAVNIGKIIGDAHDQKSSLIREQAWQQASRELSDGIRDGYNPYHEYTDANGNKRTDYNFNDYVMKDGRTYAQFMEDVYRETASPYLTEGGRERARKMTEIAFEDIALKGQRELAGKYANDREATFEQRAEIARQEDRARGDGSTTSMDTVMADGYWHSDSENEAIRRRMADRNTMDDAMAVTAKRGIDDAIKLLKERGYEGSRLASATAELRNTSNQAAATAGQEASDVYAQARKDRATIGDARRAADDLKGNNSAVNNAIDKAAGEAQKIELDEWFHGAIADVKSQDDLKELEKEFEDREGDYYKQGTLRDAHSQRLRSISDAMERQRGGDAKYADLKEEAERYVSDFHAGKIDGPTAEAGILMQNLKEKDQQDLLFRLRSGKFAENTIEAVEMDRLEKVLAANIGPDKDKNYEANKEHADEVRRMAAAWFYHADPEQRKNVSEFVDKWIAVEDSRLLRRATEEMNGIQDKDMPQVREFMNKGFFDDYSYTYTDEHSRSRPITVGGMEELQSQVIAKETSNLKDALKPTGWEIVGEAILEKDRGMDSDTGQIHFKLKDQTGKTATVRMGVDGKPEKREKSGEWVSFDSDMAESEKAANIRFERRDLSTGKIKEIDDIIEKAVRDFNSNASADPETLIRIGLGNWMSTDRGKSYLKYRMEEFNRRVGR